MGKVIKITDLSFNPNLGKVTILEDYVKNVVNAYATSIGTTQYNDSLEVLVDSLISLDVFDDMAIYPMLGSSLEALCTNLNKDADFNYNLVTASNASAGNKCIVFSNTNDIVAPSSISGFHEDNTLTPCDQYLFACIERTTDSPNGATFSGNYTGNEWALRSKTNNGVRSYGIGPTVNNNNAYGVTENGMYAGAKVYCTWSSDGTNINAKIGVSNTVSYAVGSLYQKNNNFVGANGNYVPLGTPSGFIAEGKMHFYAFAHKQMTSAKMLEVYDVFKTFIESVGK